MHRWNTLDNNPINPGYFCPEKEHVQCANLYLNHISPLCVGKSNSYVHQIANIWAYLYLQFNSH